jgi:uncharacterized membrane protein YoaK (UPF0700 family)
MNSSYTNQSSSPKGISIAKTAFVILKCLLLFILFMTGVRAHLARRFIASRVVIVFVLYIIVLIAIIIHDFIWEGIPLLFAILISTSLI